MSALVTKEDVHLRVPTELPAWHKADIEVGVECLSRSPQELVKVTDKVVRRPIKYGFKRNKDTGEEVWLNDKENAAFIRQSTGLLMMHANKDYIHLQDEDILSAIMQGLEDSGQIAPLVYAGTLDSQKYSFFRFRTNEPETIHGRNINVQLTLLVPKASQCKVKLWDHAIDTVCMNTIAMSWGQKQWELAKKQTKFAKQQWLPQIASFLEDRYKTIAKFEEDLQTLGDIACTPEQATRILAYYESKNKKSLTKREYNRAVKEEELFEDGIGNKGETMLDLYNGVTEFYSAGEGSGGKTISLEKKWSSSEFGSAMDKKVEFFKTIHNIHNEITDDFLDELANQGEAIIRNTSKDITGEKVKVSFAVPASPWKDTDDWK